MAEEFIPDNKFVPDRSVASNPQTAPAFIPDGQFQEDQEKGLIEKVLGTPEKRKDESYKAYLKRTGGIPEHFRKEPDIQETIAGIEGFGQGALPYVFNKAETALGVATPEEIRARQEKYPVQNLAANALGAGALITATGGIAAPFVAANRARLGLTAATALGLGLEGAAFGATNTLNDLALGDVDINASKIITDLGLGFGLGAGIGILSRAVEAGPSLFRRSAKTEGRVVPSSEIGMADDIPDLPGRKGLDETSIEGIGKRIDDAEKFGGQNYELPERTALLEAEGRLQGVGLPIEKIQIDALENQAAKDLLLAGKELNTDEGKILRKLESAQKQSWLNETNKVVDELAPGYKPIADAVKNGEVAAKEFSEQIGNIRKELGPKIGELKKTQINENHLPGVIDALTNEKMPHGNPALATIFDHTDPNIIKLKPYDTGMPLSKKAYQNLDSMIEDIKKDPNDFSRLFNIRQNLDNGINLLDKDASSAQLGKAKAAMMDYIQGKIQTNNPSQEVREFFKKYAINEKAAETVERTFGAKIESNGFKSAASGKPIEDVTDKIFRSTETVKAAREILGEEKFAKLVANHLAEQIEKVTDLNKFSSNKFASYLKRNKEVLNEAFRDRPEQLQKIIDLNTRMRVLPDAPSINPSGTAKTLLGAFKAEGHDIYTYAKNVGKNLKDAVVDIGETRKTINRINEALAGREDAYQKTNTLKKVIEKTTQKMESGARAIFSGKAPSEKYLSVLTAGATALSQREFEKRAKKIRELSGNMDAMMDHLDQSTGALYASAPNITESLNRTLINTVSFLSSKLPGPVNQMPLSKEYKPTPAQVAKFNKYYDIVSDPLAALTQIKTGSLGTETLEALAAVHPKLYQEMKMKVLENFKPEKAKDLPYQIKISLSKFLGEPLDENMLPQSIMSFQQSLSGPQRQSQGLKPTQKGLSELGVDERSATRSHELQKGES